MNWRLLLGGSVVTLAGLKVYSAQAVRRAKAKSPPAGQFVTVEGVRLHYLRKGAGRSVVFLHASGLVLQDFTLSIFDQTAEAYQAIAFDRPEEQAKRLHQALPRSELVMLAETGHMLHHQQPQVVLAVIQEIESYERLVRGRSFV